MMYCSKIFSKNFSKSNGFWLCEKFIFYDQKYFLSNLFSIEKIFFHRKNKIKFDQKYIHLVKLILLPKKVWPNVYILGQTTFYYQKKVWPNLYTLGQTDFCYQKKVWPNLYTLGQTDFCYQKKVWPSLYTLGQTFFASKK